MIHSDYHRVYDAYFFARADGVHNWDAGQMKYGDSLAAVCYACGIKSFEEVQRIYGFEGYGKQVDERSGRWQLEALALHKVRSPQSVLEIGAGRGEVACALAILGAKVQAVEPQCVAPLFFANTPKQVFGTEVMPPGVKLIPKTCPECLDEIDFSDVDTLIVAETLEHIPENCFTPVWLKAREALVRNKGLFVCVNWIDYHPLAAENAEHCRRVDDKLYDELSQGGTTVYRRGSHLVVQF